MVRRSASRLGHTADTTAAVFGRLLRRLRETAGLTADALALAIDFDRSMVTKVEAGTRAPSEGFAVACDRMLETGGLLAAMWAEIDWTAPKNHPNWFERRAALDEKASAIRVFGSDVLPGLVQTDAYARTLLRRESADNLDGRVAARLGRQDRFLDEDGPLLIVVLNETAVRRSVGGPAVMRQQLQHLLTIGKQSNICIQVAPIDFPDLRPPDTPLSLITMPDGAEWLYSESAERGYLNDDPSIISKYRQIYDVLSASTLNQRDSAQWISEVMERHGHEYSPRPDSGQVAQEHVQRPERRRLHRSGPRIVRRHRPRA